MPKILLLHEASFYGYLESPFLDRKINLEIGAIGKEFKCKYKKENPANLPGF
jgi:hypothetical protein